MGGESGGPTSGSGTDGDSGGEEPSISDLGLPTHRLEAPLEGSCHARAWQGGRAVSEVQPCGADGSYALALTEGTEGKVDIELLVEGHLRGLIAVEVPTAVPSDVPLDVPLETGAAGAVQWIDAPTVALGPGFRVAGQTVDARGQAVAGVTISAMPEPNLGEAEPWRVTSDAQGRFELTTLPYGPVSLQASAPGYALSVVEAISPEDQVWMVLDALIDLEGAAVAAPELLARARVRLEGSSVWPAIERPLGVPDGDTKAGGDGEPVDPGAFVFEDLPDGIYGIEIYVPPAEEGGPEYASVPLENVTPDLRVALAVVPAFRVPVRVEDPDGAAVIGARVTLGYGQLGMLQKVAESDVQGRARVGPVVPGPYILRVDADGFLPPEPVEVEVGGEGFEGEELVLVVARPARIEGIVVDEDERPVAGAEVLVDSQVDFAIGEGDARARMFAVAFDAQRTGPAGSEGSLGVTQGAVPDIPLFFEDEEGGGLSGIRADEEGRFVLDMLLPGEHRIWAAHGEHAASAVQTFEVRSGEVRQKVVLTLRVGVALTGVVRTSNGEPIAGAQVDLGDGLVLSSDEQGVFDAGFRRGKQRLVVRAPGMIPREVFVDLRGGAQDLELTLEPADERFEGRVVDGNGRPISDVEVELRPVDGLSPSLVTWTDDKGRYDFPDIGPGKVELFFAHRDYVPEDTRAKVDGAALHEFTLEPGWSIDLLVRSSGAGVAISDVRVQAGHVEAKTDESGRALLVQLVGRAVTLELSAPGWLGKSLEVRDDGSGHVELTVELFDGGALEGTIDDDIGEGVGSATVQVFSAQGELLGQTHSDSRGRWRVDGVPPGDVVLRADPPPAWSAELAPIEGISTDVLRGEVTSALRLRFERQ